MCSSFFHNSDALCGFLGGFACGRAAFSAQRKSPKTRRGKRGKAGGRGITPERMPANQERRLRLSVWRRSRRCYFPSRRLWSVTRVRQSDLGLFAHVLHAFPPDPRGRAGARLTEPPSARPALLRRSHIPLPPGVPRPAPAVEGTLFPYPPAPGWAARFAAGRVTGGGSCAHVLRPQHKGAAGRRGRAPLPALRAWDAREEKGNYTSPKRRRSPATGPKLQFRSPGFPRGKA